MRLIRFGEKGKERPGLLRDGRIVDLTEIFPDIPDLGPRFFKDGWLAKVASVKAPGRAMTVRLASPVAGPSKIICLGKNYAEHAKEGGFDTPAHPLLFAKTPNTLNGPEDPIVLPVSTGKIDWEVELAVIIGREAKRVAPADAMAYIAGFAVMNDVSGREAQFRDSQWFRGKSFDTFAPLGPALVTPDEISDIKSLKLTTHVNGKLMQEGSSADMIFDVPAILADISEDITLFPGDIIATGTPAGVGIFREPPIVLAAGDVVECAIEGIGRLKNRVIAG
jgi:2,4-diketo-3-deoxy-L-fuconate hydrolase